MRIRNARGLGLLLRQAREDRGWTQVELANRIGASRHWVMGVEKGKPKAETGLVLQALVALNLTVEVRSAEPERLARTHGTVSFGADLRDVLLQATGGTGRPKPPRTP